MNTQKIRLKKFQKQALNVLLKNQRVSLAVQSPTGSGKSLIFQYYLQNNKNERALFVTPLVALAQQQIIRLKESSISSSFYTENKKDQKSQMIMISPESIERLFEKGQWSSWCEKNRFSICILDEVHCVTEWGSDFRKSYGTLLERVRDARWNKYLYLSATFSPDLKKKLRSSQQNLIFHGKFQFPKNLRVVVKKASTEEKIKMIELLLRYKRDSNFLCFIYSRSWCEKLSAYFSLLGYSVDFFHSKRSQEEKYRVIHRLESGKVQGVFCTSAFGMGVDFKSLQTVLIWEAKGSWTELVQSMGRVGRSSECGSAVIFWSPEDPLVREFGVSVFQSQECFVNQVTSYFNNVNF